MEPERPPPSGAAPPPSGATPPGSADGSAVRLASAPARGELPSRLRWGLAAFGVVVVGVWLGLPVLAPLYLGVALVGIREYCVMMHLRGIPIRHRSLGVAAVLTLPAALPSTLPWMPDLAAGIGWREVLLGVLGLYLITLELWTPNERSVQVIAFTLFGYLYVPFTFSHLVTLRYTPDAHLGAWLLLFAMVGAIAADVGGYAFGRMFGRRPLAPAVSPNKTVEGAVGGVLLAVLVTAVFTLGSEGWLDLPVYPLDAVLLALVAAVAGQIGDLFESLLKRWSGVKDTGAFLPGHGGMLDRIDSLLVALPVGYYFVVLFVLR